MGWIANLIRPGSPGPGAILKGGKMAQPSKATILAHLIVNDASKALDFYKNAFGAEIRGVHKTPDGKVMHAELTVGGARLMLADEFPDFGSKSPKTLGGSPVVVNLYVEDDVDGLFGRAVAAGAHETMP